ncbi:pentatricopeptide repeat-containing protein At1g63400-like, partial [Trifolium pratense]|uniref:pentatricopeptide repeat-containing protein At1g63400-like n=1 Tax=Trifolium pratense TaxID=57577 RepID=UPI001E695A11
KMISENINHSIYTFSILVDAFSKEERVKEAKNMFAMMIRKGLKPNVVTYNSLMDGYCLVKEINKATGIFNTMAQMAVAPDVHSFNIMINGFCKIKMVDEAMNLFNEIKSGRISYALEPWLVNEMHDRGQPPDIISYRSILDALCKNHPVDKAIALLTKIKDMGIQPDMSYNILIDGLCKSGRLMDAQKVYF